MGETDIVVQEGNLTFTAAVLRSDSIKSLMAALADAQLAFDPILKDTNNPHFNKKYADLSAILKSTQEPLIKNGLVLSQIPIVRGDKAGVETTLFHIKSGEFERHELLLPAGQQSRFDAQTIGSALTYARRYSATTVLGVAAVDDDGNAASGRQEVPKPPQTQKPVQTAPPVQDMDKTAVRRPGRPKSAPKPPVNGNTDDSGGSSAPATTIPPAIIPNAPTGLPTDAQFGAYKARAKALTTKLAEAGLTAPVKDGKTLAVGNKVLQYVLKAGDVESISELTIAKWDTLLGLMESRDPKELVGIIEKSLSSSSND